MDEHTDTDAPATRSAVGDHPRGGETREWEVLVREAASDPMHHVGSVSAPSAAVAHEQAARLFAWTATDVWLCPAGEVRRFSTHDLDDDATPAPGPEARASAEPEPDTGADGVGEATADADAGPDGA